MVPGSPTRHDNDDGDDDGSRCGGDDCIGGDTGRQEIFHDHPGRVRCLTLQEVICGCPVALREDTLSAWLPGGLATW